MLFMLFAMTYELLWKCSVAGRRLVAYALVVLALGFGSCILAHEAIQCRGCQNIAITSK